MIVSAAASAIQNVPERMLTPDERLKAIVRLLAAGVLRASHKVPQEVAQDRAFGVAVAEEIAVLPGAPT